MSHDPDDLSEFLRGIPRRRRPQKQFTKRVRTLDEYAELENKRREMDREFPDDDPYDDFEEYDDFSDGFQIRKRP